jgi:L-arabinose isomerase
VPEISNAFVRAAIPFNVVSGTLHDDENAWTEIEEWCRAATAVGTLRGSRFGFLGHTYPGMLDMYSDFTMHQAQLGLHVEVIEMDDLQDRVEDVPDEVVTVGLEETRETFEVDESVDEEDFQWSARVSAGLDRLAEDFGLDALAYYYRGTNGSIYERLGAGLILGNSLLTARGIPASGEGDLMGHDGPGHVAISDKKPVLRGLGVYHGKAGHGVSVEFGVKTGPVTIFGVTQTREGNLKMLAAEGESLPGPTMRIGNTNSRLRFTLPPAAFMNAWCEQGPTHHCALGVGHHAGTLRKVARLLDLEFVELGRC